MYIICIFERYSTKSNETDRKGVEQADT